MTRQTKTLGIGHSAFGIGHWALSIAALSAACASAPQPEHVPTPVRTETVKPASIERGVRYSAQIIPVEQVAVSFKTSGYVMDLLQVRDSTGRMRDLEEGDAVSAGATLARVEERDYESKVARAQAGITQAKAAEDKAQQDLNRAEALFKADALIKPDLDAARAAYQSAAAQSAAARADLDVAATALRDTTLKAPRSGVVLERKLDRGALASPGTVVFTIGAVDSLKAVFGVPDAVVHQLRLGMSLTASADAVVDRTFTGRVTTIAPAADRDTHLFSVEVTIPNRDGALRPGMIATIQLENQNVDSPKTSAPAVPLTAIVKDSAKSGSYAVFVVDGQSNNLLAKLRPVTPGAIAGHGIQIASGVSAGERVIVSGAARLRDGERITVIP
jgi:multidrug efflux system membrane fusion protein